MCGDGVTDTSEQCDDGNTVTEECDYGSESCTVCAADCTNKRVPLTSAETGSWTPSQGGCNNLFLIQRCLQVMALTLMKVFHGVVL